MNEKIPLYLQEILLPKLAQEMKNATQIIMLPLAGGRAIIVDAFDSTLASGRKYARRYNFYLQSAGAPPTILASGLVYSDHTVSSLCQYSKNNHNIELPEKELQRLITDDNQRYKRSIWSLGR